MNKRNFSKLSGKYFIIKIANSKQNDSTEKIREKRKNIKPKKLIHWDPKSVAYLIGKNIKFRLILH